MDRIFDMVIIGGGPGGYTAALYAARAGLSVALSNPKFFTRTFKVYLSKRLTIEHIVNFRSIEDVMNGKPDIVSKDSLTVVFSALRPSVYNVAYLREGSEFIKVAEVTYVTLVVGKDLVEKEVTACKSAGVYRNDKHSLIKILISAKVTIGVCDRRDHNIRAAHDIAWCVNYAEAYVLVLGKALDKALGLVLVAKQFYVKMLVSLDLKKHEKSGTRGVAKPHNTDSFIACLCEQSYAVCRHRACAHGGNEIGIHKGEKFTAVSIHKQKLAVKARFSFGVSRYHLHTANRAANGRHYVAEDPIARLKTYLRRKYVFFLVSYRL